jgi:hypothetical protein
MRLPCCLCVHATAFEFLLVTSSPKVGGVKEKRYVCRLFSTTSLKEAKM